MTSLIDWFCGDLVDMYELDCWMEYSFGFGDLEKEGMLWYSVDDQECRSWSKFIYPIVSV
jgi:hypothetical protein